MPEDAENSWLTNVYQAFVKIDDYFPLSFRDGITYGYLLSVADNIFPLMAVSDIALTKLGLENNHEMRHVALVTSFGVAMPCLLKDHDDVRHAIAGEVVSFLFYNTLQEQFPNYFKVTNKFYADLSIAASTVWYFRSEIYSSYESLFLPNESVEVAGTITIDIPEQS